MKQALLGAMMVLLALALAPGVDAQEAERAERDTIAEAFEQYSEAPCESQIVFRRIVGDWHIGVEGGDEWLPIRGLWPDNWREVSRNLETIAAGDPVTMRRYLQWGGVCP